MNFFQRLELWMRKRPLISTIFSLAGIIVGMCGLWSARTAPDLLVFWFRIVVSLYCVAYSIKALFINRGWSW